MTYYKEEKISKNVFIRVFSPDIDYPWHRDAEDRLLYILSCDDNWALQIDDCLPVRLSTGGQYSIPREVFHRIIPGEGDLIVKVTKIY